MKLTIAEIVRACNGKLLSGDPQTEITSVSTDSRKISPGTLFVPIRGERVDAHMYIPAVFAAGAAATLTQNHTAVADDEQARIAVDSTERALQEIASYYRERFSIPIIGITGSVGKTTTKEMVALALSSQWNTMKTSGNQNSQIGLPLTLFQLEHEHEAAVIEMGMSYPGEMANLAKIARPMHAVITNIGLSHIENLGSQERILAEKLHITDAFTQDSILYLNGDDVHLAALREQLPQVRKIYFGTQPWCDFCARNITTGENGSSFTLYACGTCYDVKLPVPGTHNVLNALAALAVVKGLGGSLHKAQEALTHYQPPAMRQQIHRANQITIIDDSYNASPDAMKSSLDLLASVPGRHIAVLADMLELGAMEQQAHTETGAYAAAKKIDLLIAIGPRAKAYAAGAKQANPEQPVAHFESNQEACIFLRSFLTAGDVMLVKGSRAMKTDEIVKAFL